MDARAAVPPTLGFGPFRLDVQGRRLRESGRPVAIGDRAMDLLIALTERPGQVVSKAELIARVWPDLNVEEQNLRVQIAALRRALGGGAAEESYVSSAPGRGYRFIAAVEHLTTHGAPAGRRRIWPTLVDPVGRQAEIEAVARQLHTARVVTIVGPGGIGKTTLALACAQASAERYADGVTFVEVTGQADPAVEMAASLGLRLGDHEPLAVLMANLAPLHLLIVLDSGEYAIEACARLAESIVREAPRAVVLATSREPLRAAGEVVWRLAPLAVPPADQALSAQVAVHYPAVRLFVDRASASDQAFELTDASASVVADICRRLDGLPLALELAAGCVAALGFAGVQAGLDHRFQILTQGRRTAMPRHQTLAAAIDWSYDSLSADEQQALRAFSLFRSPFDAAAAAHLALGEAATAGEVYPVLSSLVAKSLVSAGTIDAPVQYRLLDTTRDYARGKLEAAGELAATAARHAARTLTMLSDANAQRFTLPLRDWLDRFGQKLDDVNAALDWAYSPDGDRSFAMPLTLGASFIWDRTARYQEQRRRIAAALEVVEAGSRAEMNLNLALTQVSQDLSPDTPEAETAALRAQELARQLGDRSAELSAAFWLWSSCIQSGCVDAALGALAAYDELALRFGESFHLVVRDRAAAVTELVAGNLTAARTATDRLLASLPAPTQPWGFEDYDAAARGRNTFQSLLWLEGAPDAAMAAAQENLGYALASGNSWVTGLVLCDALCPMALLTGDTDAAGQHLGFLETLVRTAPSASFTRWAQLFRATLAARRGELTPGVALLEAGLPPQTVHPRFSVLLTELALALGKAGASQPARRLADGLLHRVESNGERWIWSEVQRVRGELAQAPGEAEALFEAALDVAQQQGARAWALRAATSLARRRPGAAESVLRPLLASFAEGAGTQDHVEARAVLSACGLGPP